MNTGVFLDSNNHSIQSSTDERSRPKHTSSTVANSHNLLFVSSKLAEMHPSIFESGVICHINPKWADSILSSNKKSGAGADSESKRQIDLIGRLDIETSLSQDGSTNGINGMNGMNGEDFNQTQTIRHTQSKKLEKREEGNLLLSFLYFQSWLIDFAHRIARLPIPAKRFIINFGLPLLALLMTMSLYTTDVSDNVGIIISFSILGISHVSIIIFFLVKWAHYLIIVYSCKTSMKPKKNVIKPAVIDSQRNRVIETQAQFLTEENRGSAIPTEAEVSLNNSSSRATAFVPVLTTTRIDDSPIAIVTVENQKIADREREMFTQNLNQLIDIIDELVDEVEARAGENRLTSIEELEELTEADQYYVEPDDFDIEISASRKIGEGIISEIEIEGTSLVAAAAAAAVESEQNTNTEAAMVDVETCKDHAVENVLNSMINQIESSTESLFSEKKEKTAAMLLDEQHRVDARKIMQRKMRIAVHSVTSLTYLAHKSADAKVRLQERLNRKALGLDPNAPSEAWQRKLELDGATGEIERIKRIKFDEESARQCSKETLEHEHSESSRTLEEKIKIKKRKKAVRKKFGGVLQRISLLNKFGADFNSSSTEKGQYIGGSSHSNRHDRNDHESSDEDEDEEHHEISMITLTPEAEAEMQAKFDEQKEVSKLKLLTRISMKSKKNNEKIEEQDEMVP